MIESYEHEVTRKRRASRIFWMLVFFFAVFLYSFFQGYYPAIDFSWREIFSSGGVRRPEMSELMKSFGIINVSVKPSDAAITLGSGTYGNNEKRMTNYGTYILMIDHDGYISSKNTFIIDKEIPYYIDSLILVPTPTYTRIGTGMDHIANIRDNEWIAHTASGMILMNEALSSGTYVSSGLLTHIGEGYYLSGTSLVTYSSSKDIWERKVWNGSREFIEKCPSVIEVTLGKIVCKKTRSLLTEKGLGYTGVTAVYKNGFHIANTLISGTNLDRIALSGSERRSTLFIEKDGSWYSQSGGVFLSIETQKKQSPPLIIETGLESISYTTWYDGHILAFGKIGGEIRLSQIDPGGVDLPHIIPFPDIPLEAVRIWKQDGNTWIKTRSALLLQYHNNDTLNWMIDGEILAVSKEAALYRKDGIIWRADWKSER